MARDTDRLIAALEVLKFHPELPSSVTRVFFQVELHFANSGTWEELEAAIQDVDGMAEPLGPVGPLWIATQLELGREVRAAYEHTEVARDVRHNLKKFGKMRCIEVAEA